MHIVIQVDCINFHSYQLILECSQSLHSCQTWILSLFSLFTDLIWYIKKKKIIDFMCVYIIRGKVYYLFWCLWAIHIYYFLNGWMPVFLLNLTLDYMAFFFLEILSLFHCFILEFWLHIFSLMWKYLT